MTTLKTRGRPKKDPNDRVRWKYMAVHRTTYEAFLKKANKNKMTLVDYMKKLTEVDL